MTDDWAEIKARLGVVRVGDWLDGPMLADIRAALDEVKRWSECAARQGFELDEAAREIEGLRELVEELEWDITLRDVDCGCNARVVEQQKRAEAAEKRVEELEEP